MTSHNEIKSYYFILFRLSDFLYHKYDLYIFYDVEKDFYKTY